MTGWAYEYTMPEPTDVLAVAQSAQDYAWRDEGGRIDAPPACCDGVPACDACRAAMLDGLRAAGWRVESMA